MKPGYAEGFVAITRGTREISVDLPRVEVHVGLPGVIAHELGHTMGLEHSLYPGDLIYPNVHAGMCITAEDLAQLERALEAQGR